MAEENGDKTILQKLAGVLLDFGEWLSETLGHDRALKALVDDLGGNRERAAGARVQEIERAPYSLGVRSAAVDPECRIGFCRNRGQRVAHYVDDGETRAGPAASPREGQICSASHIR